MHRVYLDESGYSGEDLLNADQPVFVLATHALSEEYCESIKAKHFVGVQASELKHSKLHARPRQQKMVLLALEQILREHPAAIKRSVAHKEFALLTKIVDLVIETSLHHHGFDLYERGQHVWLSNVIFACFGVDPHYRLSLLNLFQVMMRTRTPEACVAFVDFLRIPYGLDLIDNFREMILQSFLDVGPAAVFACGKNALDLSLSMALHLISEWRMEVGPRGIEVVHDESNNMAKQKDIWDALVSPDARPAVVGVGNRAVEYPLGVAHTAFRTSRGSAALQVADLIAGATGFLAGSALAESDPDYAEQLVHLFTLELPKTSIWPSQHVEPWPATPVGVESPLDYTVEILAKLRG